MMGYHPDVPDPSERTYASLTDYERVCIIVSGMDWDRVGYDSQFTIENGRVYVATLTYDGKPELIAQPIVEFLSDYDYHFDDWRQEEAAVSS